MSINIVLRTVKCHLDSDFSFVEHVDEFVEAMCVCMIPGSFLIHPPRDTLCVTKGEAILKATRHNIYTCWIKANWWVEVGD